ncbi:MAG: serine hydrolase [Methanomicrobiaceae archaeon]|nr:serine hydrolase [Methanomicrobiaceae archaeon]
MSSHFKGFASIMLVTALLAGMILCAGCSDTQNSGTPADNGSLAGFDEFVTEKMTEYEVPGAVIGIIEDNEAVYLKGFGVRELGKPETVDPDTRFQIASVSKFVTGTAIGTLVDEGKLDWDTPVVNYLPDFALKDEYAGKHATIRDLLAHRSGLGPYDGDLLGRLGYSDSDILYRLRFLTPAASFREKYLYSNAGYFIAGEAAAEVDNRSWEELTDARILIPLGMTRSGADHDTMYLDENHVAGHQGSGDELRVMALEEAGFPAAGQVVSTGRDMTQWLRMMLNEGSIDGKEILKPGTIQQIYAASLVAGPSGPLSDPNGAVGLGCDSYNFLGERIIEKNGALDGVRSIVILIPDKNVGLVVIANKQLTVFPEAVRDEFLERYVGSSRIDLQAREKANQQGWYSLIKTAERPADAGPASIDALKIAGTYTSELYGTMILEEGPDTTDMAVGIGPNQYPATLTHWTDDTWYLTFPNPDDSPGFLTFITSSNGQVTGFSSPEFGPFSRTTV